MAGRKRTTGRQDQGQRDARTEEGQGARRSGARSREQGAETEVRRGDLNAEKIKGSSRPRGRGRQHARHVRCPDRTPSSRPCPIWRIRSLPIATHCFPRSYASPARTVDHSHCPVLAPAALAALPSTPAIPDRMCSMSLASPAAPFASGQAGLSNRE